MPKKQDVLTINFLKSSSFESTKAGKFIEWLLTAGKAIVFLTFGILIACYIYRFFLDRQIETLTDQLNDNVDQIKSYSQQENNIRVMQKQLKVIADIIDKQVNFNDPLTSLENSLPQSSQVGKLQLSNDSMGFDGKAKNEIIFAGFLANLQKDKNFSEITIDSLSSGGVQNPEINFNVNLKTGQNKTTQ